MFRVIQFAFQKKDFTSSRNSDWEFLCHSPMTRGVLPSLPRYNEIFVLWTHIAIQAMHLIISEKTESYSVERVTFKNKHQVVTALNVVLSALYLITQWVMPINTVYGVEWENKRI